ncbi:ABC transporter substrate-binding protein [Paenibacillus sp. KS-LC4]|uniref:ABC transporter substrate-binding protein n=1 Tax=Paenibacillus sp. KS-LC4 TaxID=2979727 RepID=UPI0030D4B489
MKHKEHYISLLLSLPGKQHKGTTIPITISELTEVLNCTPRNVKLVLRRLVEEGFVAWSAGVGRGHISQLTVIRGLEDVLTEHFNELLAKGKMKEAIDFISSHELPSALRDKLRAMLENRMGFQLEQAGAANLDVLRVTVTRKLGIFDPAFAFTVTEVFLLEQLYSRLIDFDSAAQRFLPSLAHAWESNDDYTAWTFYLRKGVRFHHGLLLTAEDVRFTLERLREVNSPSCWQYEDIADIEIVSDYCLVFRLRQPNPFLLHFLSCATMSILPHDVAFSEQKLLGTGAFKLVENAAQVLRLEAFDHYFRERAWLDLVEIWHIPSDAPRERQFSLPHMDAASGDHAAENNRAMDSLLDGCRYLIFNFNIPGIQHHSSFRQALRLLLDRKLLIAELGGNRAVPANSFLVASSELASYESGSLADAEALLRDSGYAGEVIKLYHHGRPVEQQDMLWLQQRAAAIGLRLKLNPYVIAEVSPQKLAQAAHLMLATEILENDTEVGLLRLFYNEDSNLQHFLTTEQQAQLRSILARYVSLPSAAERSQIVAEAEQGLRQDNWLLYLYHSRFQTQLPLALQGLAIDSFGWLDFSKLWIKK